MSQGESQGGAHAADLRRALLAIRDLRRRVDELEGGVREPVAILGMACRFPGGATTPERFWHILREGLDVTGDIPSDRWDVDAFYDPDPEAPGKTYVRRGGFLQGAVDGFDPGFFGISHREADAMDPMHRMLLEMAWEALERAAIPGDRLAGSDTGVFIGMSGSDYDILQRENLSDINSYRGTGAISSVAAGRLSHFLGVHGPNVALDTACSSALVAVALAVDAIRSGRCSMALAGTAHLILSPEGTIMLSKLRALSPAGRCRTFDAGADGYARAEGGGMFVLKKLSTALADGDPVLAVIRGVGVNHDGRSSGLTVPNPAAQRAVIEAALRDAGLGPEAVGYVEAHGTGTPLGDPIELRALSGALGRRSVDRPLWVGSVKTNLGHLEPAAGAASLAKVVLSLQHRQIPPHLHLDEPTPHVPWQELGLRVPTSLVEWDEGPRIAGLSGFGFSGTNAHLLVEEAPVQPLDPRPHRPVEVIFLSGRSREGVRELAGLYQEALQDTPGEDGVAELATTSVAGRAALPYRAAVTGADGAELADALGAIASGDDSVVTHVRSGGEDPVAFLFTGQGSQYPGMARELYSTSPTFRDAIDRCAELVDGLLDRPLVPLLTQEGEGEEYLHQTRYTQPALFAVEFALFELWKGWGITPDFVLGHSLGEYVAATVAGVMTLEEALPLVVERGRLMQELPSGGRMTSILASEERVRAALEGLQGVGIAAVNAPESVVVSGSVQGVGQVVERLAAQGARTRDLEVSHAFHSFLMDPVLDRFEEEVRRMTLRAPGIPLISNLTGELLQPGDAVDPRRWRRHIREPVRFSASVQKLAELGVQSFVEVGPHPSLSGLGAQTLGSGALWAPSLRKGMPAWQQLARSVGALFQAGHAVDGPGWTRDHAGRRSGRAPTYPFQRERFWFAESPASRKPATPGATAGVASGHPLLGAVLRSPAIDGWVFETPLEGKNPAYLGDHRVRGTVVLPAAAYLEMMTAAAARGPGWGAARLTEVTFEVPLVLPPLEAVRCQVVVSPVREGRVTVKVVSAQGPDEHPRWVTHARGLLCPGGDRRSDSADGEVTPDGGRAGLSLQERMSGMDRQVPVEELQRRLAGLGLEYGEAFQGLQELRMGEGGLLGRVALPEGLSGQLHAYGVHPALLDPALQLLLASFEESRDGASQAFLPSGIEGFRVLRPAGAVAWVHAVPREVAEPAEELLADIEILDESGGMVVEIQGFRARRLRGGLGADQGEEPILRLDWEEVSWPEDPVGPLEGSWLLLEDAGGVGAALGDALESRGGHCIRVRRADGPLSHLATRIAELGTLQGVIHCWSLDGGSEVGEEVGPVLDEVLDLTTGLPELLGLEGVAGSPHGLRVLTRGAGGAAHADTPGGAAAAALWGLLRVVQSEYPELDCRLVDLEPRGAEPEGGLLLSLLLGATPEDRLALRDGALKAPRLTRVQGPAAGASVPHAEAYRVEIAQRGTLDALGYARVPRSTPEAGEVEVRVEATGLNFRDVLNVLGMYPGAAGIPGVEFAGVVLRVGEGVGHVAPGDRVIGIGEGTFGSHVIVPAAAVSAAPASLTPAEAATIPLAFLTAEWGLTELAALRPGERVLIHAAAGGVGQAAVQLAQARGAQVFATAGSVVKRAHLRGQGVEHVFDSRSPSFAEGVLEATGGQGVDVVLNSLTGELLRRSLDILRPGGRFLEIGKAELLDPAEVTRSHPGVAYHAYDLGALLENDPGAFQALFARVTARFNRGELSPLPLRIHPAEEIAEAFRFMAQAKHIGKVVVTTRHTVGDAEPLLDPGGVYLVTGARGGVGRALVEWLVARGAGGVVLNGRSLPDEDTLGWMEELGGRSPTRLEWVSGDVARTDQASRVVDAAAAMGPLRGVFHAAGVLDDGLLRDHTRERFERVLAPKVAGAWNLDRLTRGHPLHHFVLFSSVAALLGGVGQGSYAAGNAFLEGLARTRRRQGRSALAVHWGAWEGAGMAGRLGERERRFLEDGGLGFLDPARALAAMEELMRSGMDDAVVAKVDWNRVAARGRSVTPLLHSLVSDPDGDVAQPDGEAAGGFVLEELAQLDPELRGARVSAYVRTTLSSVLGLRGREVDDEAEIAHMGFDSLMAMELRNRVEAELGVLVPVARLLEGTTSAGLAGYVLAELDTSSENGPEGATRKHRTMVEGEI